MADIKEGLYITEMMGSAINGLTGRLQPRGVRVHDPRRGALAEPVAEITVAWILVAMFQAMVPANDLRFRRGHGCADGADRRDDDGGGVS